jgi:thiosulfate dehydrogenase
MNRIAVLFTLLLVFITVGFAWHVGVSKKFKLFKHRVEKHSFVIEQAHKQIEFNLVDPEQAPKGIRPSVMRGYQYVLNTPFYLPKYCKNQLSCTNCHFCGGDTLGGKNGGISLVGVTTEYPSFSKRDGKTITLAGRITNCFRRSMNGIAPAENSQEMHDILNYLQWISKEVEEVKNIPWLGLPEIKSEHKPDPEVGMKLYKQYCLACHLADGEGGGILTEADGKAIPPIWGPSSFNDGAGMSTMKMMVPFIMLNMPYGQATLTEDEALDIAAYVLKQPRPVFTPP